MSGAFESFTTLSYIGTDDSYRNCQGAESFGWTAVHLVEKGIAKEPVFRHQIRCLKELREIFLGGFKGQANG